MRTVVFDRLARWFLRVQATLVMWPMAALPLADGDATLAFLGAAVATDIARWLLSRCRWLPLALGAAAIAGGAGSPPLPPPSSDYAGAPLFSPRSGFLSSVEAAGGGGFLFSVVVAMCVGQAGVFLVFAGERSTYIRRNSKLAERPERLGVLPVAAFFAWQIFFAVIAILAIFAGLLLKRAPADAAAALGQAAWRVDAALRFLIPSAGAAAAALWAWLLLNVNAMRQEARRDRVLAPAQEPRRCEGPSVSA